MSIMPGVQKPHWRPCSCQKPSWTGWSWPSFSSPSTVVTSRPSACTASTVHDLTGTPSSSTVQAPQWVVSQPMWVPVMLKRLAQEMDEQEARLDFRFMLGAVDLDGDRMACHGSAPPGALDGACAGRGLVRTRAISRLYSTAPRRSALGEAAAAARRAASAIASSVGCLPVR